MNPPTSARRSLSSPGLLKEVLGLICASLLLGAITYGIYPPPDPETNPLLLTWEELEVRPDPILWVDARARRDFEQGTVPGAVFLHPDVYDAQLPELLMAWTPEKLLVVFCAQEGCGLSRVVAEALRKDLNSERVFVLRGGWDRLQEEGMGDE